MPALPSICGLCELHRGLLRRQSVDVCPVGLQLCTRASPDLGSSGKSSPRCDFQPRSRDIIENHFVFQMALCPFLVFPRRKHLQEEFLIRRLLTKAINEQVLYDYNLSSAVDQSRSPTPCGTDQPGTPSFVSYPSPS